MHSWSTGGCSHIHNIDPRGDESRQDEAIAPLRGVTETAAAGVPASVVELILPVGHGQPVDDLPGGIHKGTKHFIVSG